MNGGWLRTNEKDALRECAQVPRIQFQSERNAPAKYITLVDNPGLGSIPGEEEAAELHPIS